MTDNPHDRRVMFTWPFQIFSNHIFEIGSARQFVFRVLIDTREYYSACTIDHPPEIVFRVTWRDLFKFGK